MKNSNQIKDIFQKLENGVSNDLSRKESVWEKVEQKLDKKEEKNKVIPFPVWKLSGIAASLLLMVGVGIFTWDYYNRPAVIPFLMPNSERISSTENKVIHSNEPIDSSHSNSTQIVQESNAHQPIQKKPNSISETVDSQQKIVSNVQTTSSETDGVKTKPSSFPTIQGLIVDDYGPIADAEVAVRGKEGVTITDENGNFKIDAKIGDVLTITDPMGTSQDYAVYKSNMGQLKFGSIELAAVTVTSVFSPTEKIQSGATVVSSQAIESKPKKNRKKNKNSDPEAMTSMPLSNQNIAVNSSDYKIKSDKMSVDQMLAGKVAGLNSISQNGGAPGSTGNVVIRGAIGLNGGVKEPLYVVDGIYMSGNDVKVINSDMIQNIEVLKNPTQLSVYGSRGANGVIIIKTKNGISKKELRKIKRQNRKNKGENIEQTFVPKPIEISNEEYSSFVENKFENPAVNPLSTFSVDVDKAAYSNIRRFLNNGQIVPKDAVRIEEMINYFNYNYPQPTGKHPFSIHTEFSDAPWNPGHKLLKIGLQGKNLATENLPNSNLVFLIDVSGSMNDANKLPLLKKSLELLVNNLRENDKVSIVVYAGAAGVVLDPTSGANKTTILEALNRLSAGGSTAGAAGIELAYQLAQENFIKGGNNRVILATDGDFNVGTSAVKDLETLIEEKRKSGIFLTCLGYGMGNYKDNRMETLANKGNGNYAYIDNLQEANKFLVQEFSGTLYTIAKDVKIQIEFNPQLVQSYRLIGYETRLLEDEDFANDAIDAGEIGAGHQVTALYEIIPTGVQSNYIEKAQDLKYSTYKSNNSYQNELATIKFRYKQSDGDKSTEIVQLVQNQSIPLKNASEDFKFATDVAWFGLKLRDSEYIEIKDKEKILELGKESMKNDPEGYKSEFIRLVELVK